MDFPSLKKRVNERLKKEWQHIKIAATALILAEGILAGYCITQSQNSRSDFIEFNKSAATITRNSIVYSAYEIPQQISYKLNINQVSNIQIAKALQNPKTVSGIDALMQKDDLQYYTELEGIITLDYENGKALLRFYEMPTLNGKVAEELIANIRNKNKLEEIIKDNIEVFCTVTEFDEEQVKQKLKEKKIDQLIQEYFTNTDNIAKHNWQELSEFYYANLGDIEGKIIGKFHTHNDAIEPSKSDIRKSKLERQIVIGKEWNKYTAYDITKGKINKSSVKRR